MDNVWAMETKISSRWIGLFKKLTSNPATTTATDLWYINSIWMESFAQTHYNSAPMLCASPRGRCYSLDRGVPLPSTAHSSPS